MQPSPPTSRSETLWGQAARLSLERLLVQGAAMLPLSALLVHAICSRMSPHHYAATERNNIFASAYSQATYEHDRTIRACPTAEMVA